MIEFSILKTIKNPNQLIDCDNKNRIIFSNLHQKYQFQYFGEKNLIIDTYHIQFKFNKIIVLNEYISVRKTINGAITDKFGYKIPKPFFYGELSNKNKKKILDLYIIKLIDLNKKYQNSKILFSSSYFQKTEEILEKYWFNKLHASCDFNETEFISVVELRNDFDEIKKNFRKSYKSLIDEKKFNISLKIIDKNNLQKKNIDTMRKFHEHVSGRVTRSKYTWQIQFEMILSGKAFVICIYQQNDATLLSFSFIEINGIESMYSVGVYDRSQRKIPLGHIALANAIKYSKDIGCKKFTLGEFLGSGGVFTEKEKSISNFKNGFASSNELEVIFGCQN